MSEAVSLYDVMSPADVIRYINAEIARIDGFDNIPSAERPTKMEQWKMYMALVRTVLRTVVYELVRGTRNNFPDVELRSSAYTMAYNMAAQKYSVHSVVMNELHEELRGALKDMLFLLLQKHDPLWAGDVRPAGCTLAKYREVYTTVYTKYHTFEMFLQHAFLYIDKYWMNDHGASSPDDSVSGHKTPLVLVAGRIFQKALRIPPGKGTVFHEATVRLPLFEACASNSALYDSKEHRALAHPTRLDVTTGTLSLLQGAFDFTPAFHETLVDLAVRLDDMRLLPNITIACSPTDWITLNHSHAFQRHMNAFHRLWNRARVAYAGIPNRSRPALPPRLAFKGRVAAQQEILRDLKLVLDGRTNEPATIMGVPGTAALVKLARKEGIGETSLVREVLRHVMSDDPDIPSYRRAVQQLADCMPGDRAGWVQTVSNSFSSHVTQANSDVISGLPTFEIVVEKLVTPASCNLKYLTLRPAA